MAGCSIASHNLGAINVSSLPLSTKTYLLLVSYGSIFHAGCTMGCYTFDSRRFAVS